MYASFTRIHFKPGGQDIVFSRSDELVKALSKIAGLEEFMILKEDENTAISIALYDNPQSQKNGVPQVQEILGGMAEQMAGPPERKGCDVPLHTTF